MQHKRHDYLQGIEETLNKKIQPAVIALPPTLFSLIIEHTQSFRNRRTELVLQKLRFECATRHRVLPTLAQSNKLGISVCDSNK
mmetsp:Transcript_24393/g.57413  ORF Transcript_24393/g.57413 Transcript_24393/m.57413 type:complete len:84 (+) Transcript_24393:302-553(+)